MALPAPAPALAHAGREALVSAAADERLVSFFGRPEGDGAVLTAVTAAEGGLRIRRATADRTGWHALTDGVPAFHVFEREVHEQLGLPVRGHPWLKPVRFEAGANTDDHPFLTLAGRQGHEVQVGPIHAGVIEPGAFRFLCHGEVVEHLEIHLGYQHRGLEARLLRTPPFAALPLVEVIAGDTSVAHAWAWSAAVEALAGLEVAEPVRDAREVMLELERVAMHLAGLSGLALDIGALQAATTWQRLRTTVINTSMRLCGSRFGRTAIRPGGSGVAWDERARDRVLADLADLAADEARVVDHFFGSRLTPHRFAGCGVVPTDAALALGLVGPAARASGVALDGRAWPGFTPVVRRTGDVLARAEVRALEIPVSLARVRALLERHPALLPARAAPAPLAPDHLAVATVEGWRGEVVHAIETGPDGAVRHCKVQDPSLRNWPGLALALRGEDISDFPINNKSFDLSYCGNDL